MKTALVVTLSLCAAVAVDAAQRVSVTVPAVVVDGEPILATVTIHNDAPVPLAVEPHRNLRLDVQQTAQTAAKPCFLRVQRTMRPTPQSLAGLETGTYVFNLLADYPAGLIPGRYSVVARFIDPRGVTTQSATSQMEVLVPTRGELGEQYRAFSRACSALGARNGAAMLRFAQQHQLFPYNPALLERALLLSEGGTREQIAALLVRQYATTSAAETARRDLLEQRELHATWRALAEHQRAYDQELRKPENREAAKALQRLGAILDPQAFARHEEFLRRFGDTYFAPDVLFGMIIAAENGVLPSGATDGTTVVRTLRERLLTRYAQSFSANELRRAAAE